MKKLPIFIMNIFVAIVSAVAIFMYLYAPFFKVSVSYTVRASDFEDAMEVEGIDLKEALGDLSIDLGLTIELDSIPMIEMLFHQDSEATVQKLVSSNVNRVINMLTKSINDVIDDVIKAVVKETIKKELKSQVKDHLLANNEAMTEEEMNALFERAGFTDEYIDKKTEKILDELLSHDATVDSITNTTVTVAKDVFTDLKNSGEEEFADLEFSEENQQTVEDSVSSTLDLISEEDGSVNTDLYINTFMLQLVKSMNSDDGDGDGDGETTPPDSLGKTDKASPLSYITSLDDESTPVESEEEPAPTNPDKEEAPTTPDKEDPAPTAPDKEEKPKATAEEILEELNAEVSKMIRGFIPEGINHILAIVFNILAALLVFSIFTWAYLIIKILFKLLAKNPAIKLKLPIWLGWIPFLLFWVLPFAVVKILPSYLPNLLPEEILSIISSMNISFFSSGIYAFGAAIALIILWIPYGRMRKRRKKLVKAKKEAVSIEEDEE